MHPVIRVTNMDQVPKFPLRWRHNGRDSVSNHQPHDCLLSRLFRRRSKKTSKLRVTGLCSGNSPGTGEFPAQMASYAENVSIWWRHWSCDFSFKLMASSWFWSQVWSTSRSSLIMDNTKCISHFYECPVAVTWLHPKRMRRTDKPLFLFGRYGIACAPYVAIDWDISTKPNT